MLTLTAAIVATFTRRASAPALFWNDGTYSFADIDRGSAAAAAELIARGIRPGDRVAVGLPNSLELVVAVLGVLRAGAVLVPLNPAYSTDELTYIVGDAGTRIAIVTDEHATVLASQRPPTLVAVLTALAGPSVTRFETAPVGPEAPALIVYTSGTTGRPKGAVLSHHALVTNFTTVARAWHWTEQDRLLLTLPCFHLHGLGLGIITSMVVGSSVVLRSRFNAETTLGDLRQSEATMFFGVPTMYNRLVALPENLWRASPLPAMRLWVSGSAPLSPATYERFRALSGFSLMDRYGMTECGFVLATPYEEPRRPGVVGRSLPGVTVRIIDPDAADLGRLIDVPDGAQGEIAIHGPNLFDGYWNRPEETARAFLDGCLRSGDLAVREPDGMVRIVGRNSVDIIKTRGFKVGAVEIESCLQRCPGVQEVAVVGVPDSDQGERVVAAVTPLPGVTLTADTVRQFARAHLAPNKVPSSVVFLDEIPRTGPGKFKKKALIQQLTGTPTTAS